MNADDGHGTYAAYNVHIKAGEQPCEPCRRVGNRVRKHNTYLAQIGSPASVPVIGTLRRVQALRALGYSAHQIAEAGGLPWRTIDSLGRGSSVYRATAERIAKAFDRLSMQPLPTGRAAAYNRTIARKNGWPPPLAWNNPDDPDEQPYAEQRPSRPGHPETATATLEDFDWLTKAGESPEQVAARLGVTLATIERYRLRVAARAVAC